MKLWTSFLLICFACAVVVVAYPLSQCSVNDQEQSKNTTNSAKSNVEVKKHDAANNDNKSDKDNISSRLCREFKVADWLIAYFTLCLVIVGAFTLYSADLNTKRKERAHVITAGLWGKEKDEWKGKWARGNRAKASMFEGPWWMAIWNMGQTPGFTTKVEWGLCEVEEFPKAVRVTDLLDLDCFAEWRVKWMSKDSPCTLEDIFDPSKEPRQYRHVRYTDRKEGCVFFGRIRYRDVFRDPHYSTFAMELVADHVNAIPASFSEDHD